MPLARTESLRAGNQSLLTVADVAQLLKINRRTVLDLILDPWMGRRVAAGLGVEVPSVVGESGVSTS